MTVVSTDAVRPGERLDYWQDVVCSVFTRCECRTASDATMHGSVKVIEAGNVDLCETISTSIDYRREAAHVRAASTDHILANYMVRGTGQVFQGGQCAVQREGDLVLFDTSRPYLLHYPVDVISLTVKISRTTLLSREPQGMRAMVRCLSGSSPIVALVGSVLREANRQERVDDRRVAGSIGGLLADVIAAAVRAEMDLLPVTTSRHHALLDRLKCYLLDNLGDPTITIERLAAAHYIGERTVNRLFAAEGMTAMRWLWGQRLAASHRALSEGPARQITATALTYGFTNFSHFSRSFKKAYGIQPYALTRSAERQAGRVAKVMPSIPEPRESRPPAAEESTLCT